MQTVAGSMPGFRKFTERNFEIVAALEKVAAEAGYSMPQVALNWLHQRAGVASIIVGATKPEQLEKSLPRWISRSHRN